MKLKAAALTLVLGLLAVPVPAEARQVAKVYRLGFLAGISRTAGGDLADIFLQELHELGWVEGQNLIVEERWAEGRVKQLPDLAAELVRLKVDITVTVGTQATLAATNATKTIPIVFSLVSNPVGSGFVASYARPGGNVTGLAAIVAEIAGKQLELLKETVPGLSRLAVLWDPTQLFGQQFFKQAQVAAQALGVPLQSVGVRDPKDFESAFSAMTRDGADALMVSDTFLFTHQRRIADLARKHRLPAMFILPGYVREGGLMAYAPSLPAMFRRAAHYVDKILKGAKPANLPVERPTEFELWINMKTASALGLTIPPSVLFRADRVIK
ncbi:MAG: ABC transporter substrate-binding protein [Anaerolineae bacterium]